MVTAPSASALPRAMQVIGSRYVPYFNSRYNRTGTLFEGRYRSIAVYDERYWAACMRYIELNPVRAGLVRHPAEYRWSSYRAHALGRADSLLTDHAVFRGLGNAGIDRCHFWESFCAQGIADAELRKIREMIHSGVATQPVTSAASEPHERVNGSTP